MRKPRIHLCLAWLLTAALCALLAGCQKESTSNDSGSTSGLPVGYEEGVVEVSDSNALQEIVDRMSEEQLSIGLEYQPSATSGNGVDFTCYIANPANQGYDMFFAIYGDAAYTDELYVSGLLRPGTAVQELTLNHALNPGNNTVYIVYSLVDMVDGEQTIIGQRPMSMFFAVKQ